MTKIINAVDRNCWQLTLYYLAYKLSLLLSLGHKHVWHCSFVDSMNLSTTSELAEAVTFRKCVSCIYPVRTSTSTHYFHRFLGALAKLRKETRHVCPRYARKNSSPVRRILMKFDIWRFFRKPVEKIQVLLQSDKDDTCFKWRPVYIYDNVSLNYAQNEKCFRQNNINNQLDATVTIY